MEKFIPYEKLSKKEKRKINAAKRNTWGNLNPVTRKPQNSKAYNRNKTRNWKREMQVSNSGYYFFRLVLHAIPSKARSFARMFIVLDLGSATYHSKS